MMPENDMLSPDNDTAAGYNSRPETSDSRAKKTARAAPIPINQNISDTCTHRALLRTITVTEEGIYTN